MNSQQIAAAFKPTTIGQLKKYIADMEAKWTTEDVEYLGVFDEQPLYMNTEKGVAHAFMQYHGEFGLIAFQHQV